MPTYDYVCKACHLEFEVQQKITEDKLKHHLNVDSVKCGPVERLISQGGSFKFKGGSPTSKTYR